MTPSKLGPYDGSQDEGPGITDPALYDKQKDELLDELTIYSAGDCVPPLGPAFDLHGSRERRPTTFEVIGSTIFVCLLIATSGLALVAFVRLLLSVVGEVL